MSDATTLPAGRELDARIAEKVMGWEYHDEDGTWRRPNGRLVCLDEEIRPYSTDIAAAWEVVEKMQAGDEATWERFADLLTATASPLGYRDAAETAEFICRAALAAVEAA